MVTVTSEEARDGLGELMNRVAYGGERVMVTRRGKKIVGIISAEELELLEAVLDAVEDKMDAPLVKERMAEIDRGDYVTLEQLKSKVVSATTRPAKPRVPGSAKGKISLTSDFNAPLPDVETIW